MSTIFSTLYVTHIHSEKWAEFRRQMIEAAAHRCQRCHDFADLEIHHLHYGTLGRERPEDVEVLCHPCHEQADEERRSAIWHKRVEAWARKKYGIRWERIRSFDEADEEFADWLERKGEL